MAIQSVKHCMTCAVSCTGASVSLTALSKVKGLTSESPLVDFTFIGAGERETVAFELEDCCGGFLAHVLDRVLVSEPVAAFDGIVGVPSPVVFCHVGQGCVDAALSCDGVGASGE